MIDSRHLLNFARCVNDANGNMIFGKFNIIGLFSFTLFSAPRDQGYEQALTAFQHSRESLGRGELDLYLIHWPGTRGLKQEDPQNRTLRYLVSMWCGGLWGAASSGGG